jgi:hypothetical protein
LIERQKEEDLSMPKIETIIQHEDLQLRAEVLESLIEDRDAKIKEMEDHVNVLMKQPRNLEKSAEATTTVFLTTPQTIPASPPKRYVDGGPLVKPIYRDSGKYFGAITNCAGGMKRKLQELVEKKDAHDDFGSDITDSLSVLGLQKDGVVAKVLEYLDDLDDDGFEELSEFQNRKWIHFCPSMSNLSESTSRREHLGRMHKEFCDIIESKLSSFLHEQFGCTMEKFYTLVQVELRKVREQEDALTSAFSLCSEPRAKRRCVDRTQSGASGQEATTVESGHHQSHYRHQQRSVKVGHAGLEALLAGDDHGAMGLIKFINEASDFGTFVANMEDHAANMLRWRDRLKKQKGGGKKAKAGDFTYHASYACTWCSRKPCFDPGHRIDKSKVLATMRGIL